jgi:hypothetical protein
MKKYHKIMLILSYFKAFFKKTLDFKNKSKFFLVVRYGLILIRVLEFYYKNSLVR